MPEKTHLYAFEFVDNQARPLNWEQAGERSTDQPPLWVHFDRTSSLSKAWLRDQSSIDQSVIDGLLASATRPRMEIISDGLLLTLRGVNLNEDADPADMVSLRIWVEPNRLISLERERLRSVMAIAEQMELNRGPTSIEGLLVAIISALTEKMGPVIDGINERLDDLEDRLVDPDKSIDRAQLLSLRQQAIMLHRYLKPQVQTIMELHQLKKDSMDPKRLRILKETINRVTRYVEDLEAVRGRATVIQDELSNRYAERMNNRMYAVSLIATILLPMSIITGLLGINVGGIPGSDSPLGFTLVCVILAVIGVGGFATARRFDWL